MSDPSSAGPVPRRIDPRRHPAALAAAIAVAWRPYRWRAYAAGLLAGLIAGGLVAPILTTSIVLVLTLAGAPRAEHVPWPEYVWSAVFGATTAFIGATAFARWQPPQLRMAVQSYIWLASQAEKNWARTFGSRPVPRDEARTRAVLDTIPETPETAGERFGLWLAVLELDRARTAVESMPTATAYDRFGHDAAEWLIDFVGGDTRPLESLERTLEDIGDHAQRLEALATLAVNRARVAYADSADWLAPLASVRESLGIEPEQSYRELVWRPAFRALLRSMALALVVFWLAMLVGARYFPVG